MIDFACYVCGDSKIIKNQVLFPYASNFLHINASTFLKFIK